MMPQEEEAQSFAAERPIEVKSESEAAEPESLEHLTQAEAQAEAAGMTSPATTSPAVEPASQQEAISQASQPEPTDEGQWPALSGASSISKRSPSRTLQRNPSKQYKGSGPER